MIDVKSLRIGNNIWHTRLDVNTNEVGNFIVTVDGNLIKTLELQPYLPYNYIDITDELLIRCGFVSGHRGLSIFNGVISLKKYKDGRLALTSNYKSYVINHFHQLQNLCYSLTGEELTYQHSPINKEIKL